MNPRQHGFQSLPNFSKVASGMVISAQSQVSPLAVIMSVYCRDEPEQLRASLESIISQSVSGMYQVRLYLAIDGPVSPQIDNVISEYEAQIYRMSRLDVNRGLAAALNVLIGNLEDEAFIFRMDADDISLPDRFEKQLAFMDRNPDVDICLSSFEISSCILPRKFYLCSPLLSGGITMAVISAASYRLGLKRSAARSASNVTLSVSDEGRTTGTKT